MDMKTTDMDMLHGALTGKLLRFTLPVALSSIVQQLFNAADTAVVGYFCDADALAAVGTNTEIIALIVTVSCGLSIGANVLAARLIGRGERRAERVLRGRVPDGRGRRRHRDGYIDPALGMARAAAAGEG